MHALNCSHLYSTLSRSICAIDYIAPAPEDFLGENGRRGDLSPKTYSGKSTHASQQAVTEWQNVEFLYTDQVFQTKL